MLKLVWERVPGCLQLEKRCPAACGVLWGSVSPFAALGSHHPSAAVKPETAPCSPGQAVNSSQCKFPLGAVSWQRAEGGLVWHAWPLEIRALSGSCRRDAAHFSWHAGLPQAAGSWSSWHVPLGVPQLIISVLGCSYHLPLSSSACSNDKSKSKQVTGSPGWWQWGSWLHASPFPPGLLYQCWTGSLSSRIFAFLQHVRRIQMCLISGRRDIMEQANAQVWGHILHSLWMMISVLQKVSLGVRFLCLAWRQSGAGLGGGIEPWLRAAVESPWSWW